MCLRSELTNLIRLIGELLAFTGRCGGWFIVGSTLQRSRLIKLQAGYEAGHSTGSGRGFPVSFLVGKPDGWWPRCIPEILAAVRIVLKRHFTTIASTSTWSYQYSFFYRKVCSLRRKTLEWKWHFRGQKKSDSKVSFIHCLLLLNNSRSKKR